MKRDAGLLFATCWLLGLGYFLALGRIHVIGAIGFAFVPFIFGGMFLIGLRRSPNRLRSAVIAAAALTAFALMGALR